MEKNIFESYYKKIRKQGIIKALILGAMVGFIVLTVLATIFWIVGFKGLLVCILSFVGVTALAAVASYFLLYKPDTKEIAKRIDECGLEERMITMYELQDSDSFIARRQRQDAEEALAKTDAKLLKFALAIPVVVLLACFAVSGTAMTVVEGLYTAGAIDSVIDIVTPEKEIKFFTVEYEVLGDGYITGDIVQVVEEGKDCSPILAEPEEGFVFVGWSYVDENGNDVFEGQYEEPNPARSDENVTYDVTYIAVFQEAEGEGEGEGEGQGQGEGEGQPNGAPQDGEGEGEGEGEGQGDGQGDGGKEGGQGGRSDAANQVYDGNTYYGGSTYDNAYGDAVDSVAGNGGVSSGDAGIVSGYFDSIKN